MCSTIICTGCGIEIEDGEFRWNGLCIDCSSDEWGKLVEISPMVSPRMLLRIPKDETPIDENRKAEKGELIVVLAEYDYKLKYYDDYVGGSFDASELEEVIETAKNYKRNSVLIRKEIFVGVYDDEGKLCFWAR